MDGTVSPTDHLPGRPARDDRAVALDLLRGGAVIGILILHYVWATGILRTPEGFLKTFDQALSPLTFCVEIFFALSGYLIASSLIRTADGPVISPAS